MRLRQCEAVFNKQIGFFHYDKGIFPVEQK